MAKRKRIKHIVYSLADSIMSRNTDIDGYWAPGIFYEQAHYHSRKKFILDIITKKSCPEYQYSYVIANKFHSMILNQLKNNKLHEKHVSQAKVTFYFDIKPDEGHFNTYRTCGEAMNCIIELTDDLGNKYTLERKGWCGRYKKHKNRRSARRLTITDIT